MQTRAGDHVLWTRSDVIELTPGDEILVRPGTGLVYCVTPWGAVAVLPDDASLRRELGEALHEEYDDDVLAQCVEFGDHADADEGFRVTDLTVTWRFPR